MKELIDHIKKVAIQDTRDFFAPLVAVFRAIRSLIRASSDWIERRLSTHDKDDAQ